MKLYKAAKNTLIGYCIYFCINYLFIFFSLVSRAILKYNFYILVVMGLHLAMCALWLLFYMAFRQEFLLAGQVQLKNVIRLVIYAYMADLVLSLLLMMAFFGNPFSLGNWIIHLQMLLHWLQTILVHILFLKLFIGNLHEEYPSLKKALLLMILGTFISFVVQTWISIKQVYFLFTYANLELLPESVEHFILFAGNSVGFLIFFFFLFKVYKRFKPGGSPVYRG